MAKQIEPATIECEMTAIKPEYKSLAIELLDEIRAFFALPENEAEFQRWKAEREKAS